MLNLSRELIKIKRLVFLVSTLFLLSSCLTLESDLKLNTNGSGTLNILYKIDKNYWDISNYENRGDIAPFNLSEEYIKEVVKNSEDISYSKYSTVYNKDYVIINVTFDFKTIDGLNKLLPIDNQIKIEAEGESTILKQKIVDSTESVVSESNLKLFKDIFKEDYITLKIRTPKKIKEVVNGVKESSKVATYNDKIINIIQDPNQIDWVIRW